MRDYYLGRVLDDVLAGGGFRQVGCIHEMHAYSRIVWSAAARSGASRHTVQHASITSGKRWYFPDAIERDAGLEMPDTMHVFSERVADMLARHLPETRFILGCSARYARWRDAKPFESGGRVCLVVGALARFDNDVVFSAARRLLDQDATLPVRLRLHPHANASSTDRAWLRRSERGGRLEVSEGIELEADIEDAAVVLGMGTTVLEEALVLGRPVVQLTHPEFVRYVELDDVGGVTIVPANSLCVEDVKRALQEHVDIGEVRDRLGLDHPVVTYEQLFSSKS
ncbi:MAG: hypothetical protein JRE40_00380 [Deltaproteobacteria bacterium]|nr:hypothetical protein [Deltaproteobacteria bacterium]